MTRKRRILIYNNFLGLIFYFILKIKYGQRSESSNAHSYSIINKTTHKKNKVAFMALFYNFIID